MAFDSKQFRSLIERTLDEIGMNSPAAVSLLLGTAAQESHFGTYLRQIKGPALGAFQIEPSTFDWLRRKYGPVLGDVFCRRHEELEYDIRLSIIMARLKYKSILEALPSSTDIDGLAAYWKQYFNTPKGKGTVEEFKSNYAKYVKL